MDRIQQWVVTDDQGTPRTFEAQPAALVYALEVAGSHRGTTVKMPGGDEFVIIRRDSCRTIQIVTTA